MNIEILYEVYKRGSDQLIGIFNDEEIEHYGLDICHYERRAFELEDCTIKREEFN